MNQPQPNDSERQIIIGSAAGSRHLPSVDYQETVAPLQDDEIHLRDYLDVLARRKWVVMMKIHSQLKSYYYNFKMTNIIQRLDKKCTSYQLCLYITAKIQ